MLATSVRRALFSVALLISAVNAQIGNTSASSSSCTKALAQEDKQVASNMAAIQKQYVDVENPYNKDVIDCGGGQGAAACIMAAQNRLTQSRKQIDKQKSDEIDRHKKALIDIKTGACASGSSTPGQPTSGGTGTAPSAGGNDPD
jgi:hypothetical protein